MRRRQAITVLMGAAVAWPLAARAQQAGKLPTIGFLGESTPSGQRRWAAAFVQRLRELGWFEGRNFAIEYRWAEGRNERFAELVSEFVRLKVDAILDTRNSSGPRSKAGNFGHPHRLRDCGKSGRHRVSCESWRSRRQCHRSNKSDWPILPANVSNLARSCPRSPAIWQSWPTLTIPRSLWTSVRCRQLHADWPRSRHIGNPACRGYRARHRGDPGQG